MRRILLALVMVMLLASVASAAVPALTAGRDSTLWQGENFWWKWVNTADNGTAGLPTTSMGINWGDGNVNLLAAPTDTTASHAYAKPGTYTISLTGVNSDGTGKTHTHVTVNSWMTRAISVAGTKIYLPSARDLGANERTLNSDSAFRVNGWRGAIKSFMSWPIAAGVPWTIPADYDSLIIPALTDTVWDHVWDE